MAFSQDNSDRKTPEIVSKVLIGDTATLPDGSTITLTHIGTDSRCPKGTTCIWAGEVEFHISIKHNEKQERKELKMGATTTNKNPEVLKTENYTVVVTDITPAPEVGKEIEAKDYKLHFVVKKTSVKNAQ